MNLLLIILLILVLAGTFHYSPTIGNYPMGVTGIVLIVVRALAISGRI